MIEYKINDFRSLLRIKIMGISWKIVRDVASFVSCWVAQLCWTFIDYAMLTGESFEVRIEVVLYCLRVRILPFEYFLSSLWIG